TAGAATAPGFGPAAIPGTVCGGYLPGGRNSFGLGRYADLHGLRNGEGGGVKRSEGRRYDERSLSPGGRGRPGQRAGRAAVLRRERRAPGPHLRLLARRQ